MPKRFDTDHALMKIEARFADRHVPVPYTGCDLWTHTLDNCGYGKFSWKFYGHVGDLAHRWVMEHHLGRALATEEVVMHTCDEPACVNLDHLVLGTQADNVADMFAKGRNYGLPDINRAKTHCSRGHEYNEENTYYYKSGARACRKCTNARARRYRKEYREANPIPEKTHCKYGHPLSGDNLRVSSAGSRFCRACTNKRARDKRAEFRAANPIKTKTHCRNGHEYTPENTYHNTKGVRVCKICRTANNRAWRKNNRGFDDDSRLY